MDQTRKQAYLALLTTSIVWGFAPPIIKDSFEHISPVNFLFFRFLLVSLILIIPLIYRFNKIKSSRKDLYQYLILGFLATPLNLSLYFLGLNLTTSIDASIISITTPILIIIGGALFLKETIDPHERIGISLALAGTIVTIVQPLLENGVNFSQNILGNFLVFFGSLEWAVFTLLSKKNKHLDSLILTSISFILGFLIFTPFYFLQNINRLPYFPPPESWFGIIYMAGLGSVVAYFTYVWGLKKIEASEATLFTYLQPLFSVPLGALWLKEKITLPFLLGALLIASGVFMAENKPGVKTHRL